MYYRTFDVVLPGGLDVHDALVQDDVRVCAAHKSRRRAEGWVDGREAGRTEFRGGDRSGQGEEVANVTFVDVTKVRVRTAASAHVLQSGQGKAAPKQARTELAATQEE